MNFVKNYLKYVILAVVLAVMTIVIGIINIKDICYAEENKSSYTRTKFDFWISAPSAEQVDSLTADSSVGAVFPYYSVQLYKDNQKRDLRALVYYDDSNAELSLLASKTLVEGSYDSDGAMMDVNAAKLLGVKVGDKFTFNLLGVNYTKRVSALYLASTYPSLSDGVVMFKAPEAAAFNEKFSSYQGAFLSSNDKAATSALLKDYVGQGDIDNWIDTFDVYVTKNGLVRKPSNLTEEQFEEQRRQKYQEYYNLELAKLKNSQGRYAEKDAQYRLIQDKIQTTEKKINRMIILTSVAVFVLFIIAGVVFVITNKRNDRIRCDGGMPFMRMAGGYILTAAITAVAVSLVTMIALIIVASGTYFFSSCMTTLLAFTFSAVCALPFVAIAVIIYTKLLYSSSAEL